MAENAAFKAGKTPTPAPAVPGAPGTDKEAKKPTYALTIPKEVQDFLTSDDPAQNVAAVQHIANSLATIVHTQVMAEVNARLEGLLREQENRQAMSAQEQQIAEAKNQYFTAFPAHNDPLVLPLVQQAAQQLAVEFPNLTWNEQYIASLGARVNQKLDQLRGGPAPAPAPAPATPAPPAPAPKPPAMMPFGVSGGGIPAFEQDQAEIDSTFGWNT